MLVDPIFLAVVIMVVAAALFVYSILTEPSRAGRFSVFPQEPSEMMVVERPDNHHLEHFSLSRAEFFAIPDGSLHRRDTSDIRAKYLLPRVVPLLTARIKSAYATGNGICYMDYGDIRPRAAQLPADVVAAILAVDPTSAGCDATIAGLLPDDILLDFVTVLLKARSKGYWVVRNREAGLWVRWG